MQFALCDAFHKITHNRKPLNILCASPARTTITDNKKDCKENDLTVDGLWVRFSFGVAENRLRVACNYFAQQHMELENRNIYRNRSQPTDANCLKVRWTKARHRHLHRCSQLQLQLAAAWEACETSTRRQSGPQKKCKKPKKKKEKNENCWNGEQRMDRESAREVSCILYIPNYICMCDLCT